MKPVEFSSLLQKIGGIEHGFTTKHLHQEQLIALEDESARVKQVHRNKLIWATQPENKLQEADAVATTAKGLRIGVYSADCTPILILALDKAAPIACLAIHAGWRGTAQKIAQSALQEFAQTVGKQFRYMAVIGPCISKARFEVGEEVVNAFPQSKEHGLVVETEAKDGQKKFLFDLPGENFRQLTETGKALNLQLEIDDLGHCTHSDESKYPSYRREKNSAGRIFSYIKIF